MQTRDRIKELRRVKAKDLYPNPRNWRTHPKGQQDALRGILAEIGYADALLARELPDGSLELIDGHLRAETTPEQEVPVLILDLDQDEANKLLTVLDPLAAMAETNTEQLKVLVEQIDAKCRPLLAAMGLMSVPNSSPDNQPVAVPNVWSLVISCANRVDQTSLYARLIVEGRQCRSLTT